MDALEVQARRELEEESWREKVEARKAAIREARRRPWWVKLFPFRLRIERL